MIKSKDRVQIFGEVFTPPYYVDKMISYPDFAPHVTNIYTKILEPTFGEGIFITEILSRRIENLHDENLILTALSNLYGVEILPDNVQSARQNIFAIVDAKVANKILLQKIIAANFLQGNFLTRKNINGDKIFFRNWQIPSANFKTFTLDALANRNAPQLSFDFERRQDQVTDDEFDELMKNFVIVGNPPYQEDSKGGNQNYASPVYHKFLQEAHNLADEVLMIHPARCLFNAGGTPKKFNEQLLTDPHVKVVLYEPDSSKVFQGVDIKGGVAVTYRNANQNFGAIGTFTSFDELNSILHKVTTHKDFLPLSEIMYSRAAYTLTKNFHKENPTAKEKMSVGNTSPLSTNIFEIFPDIFMKEKPTDGDDYIKIFGRCDNERVHRWVKRSYISNSENLSKFKIFVADANGAGTFGEVLSSPFIGAPFVVATQTFLSIGAFDTLEEATATLKYVKTKFARAMLGTLKVTQHNPPDTWAKVPQQNFRADSELDWAASVAAIDAQLYAKYGLTPQEINFIESNVKEMRD